MGYYAQVLFVLGLEKNLSTMAADDVLERKLQDAAILVKKRAPKRKELNISTHDNSLDLKLAAEVAPFFRLTDLRATTIIQNTTGIVSKWKQIARNYKISSDEQDRMSPAFSAFRT